jgi:hypothetical protein
VRYYGPNLLLQYVNAIDTNVQVYGKDIQDTLKTHNIPPRLMYN